MVSVNDRAYPYRPGLSLPEILKEDNVDIHDSVLITLNGTLVRRDDYNGTVLQDGDEVLVIRVSSGG